MKKIPECAVYEYESTQTHMKSNRHQGQLHRCFCFDFFSVDFWRNQNNDWYVLSMYVSVHTHIEILEYSKDQLEKKNICLNAITVNLNWNIEASITSCYLFCLAFLCSLVLLVPFDFVIDYCDKKKITQTRRRMFTADLCAL